MTTQPDRTLLALNGLLPSPGLLRDLRRTHPRLIAADGAAAQLLDIGIVPDVVVGDMDSLDDGMVERLRSLKALIVPLPDQEHNDFEKAMRWILRSDPTPVTIVGIAGGMTDHTLNNFSVLAKFAGLPGLILRDDLSAGHIVSGELVLDTVPGSRISLIPLPSATVSTRGLVWQLECQTLALGQREGASNRAASDRIEITVHSGIVLVFRYL